MEMWHTPERFWSLVDKSGECWLWTLSTRFGGYGQWQWNGKNTAAHRIAWEITHGPIAKGMCICHRCDTPLCVRPDHLFIGTQRDNLADMFMKQRGTPGYAARPPYGETNNRAKVTVDQVREIRKAYAQGDSLRTLGRRYGIDFTAISSIVRRKTWAHVHDGEPIPASKRAHKGSRSHKAKLTEADIPAIRAKHAAGIGSRRIAQTYGVSHQAIEKITSGRNWRHVL